LAADDSKDGADVYNIEAQDDALPPNGKDAHPSKRSRPDGPGLDTTKPSAVFKPREGRKWTLSIAVPGSFIAK